jgi:hypothetical protein
MSDYRLAQLKTVLLVKHLNELNAHWEEHIVLQRIYELDEEYAQTQEYQERSAGQEQLFHLCHSLLCIHQHRFLLQFSPVRRQIIKAFLAIFKLRV